MILSRAEIPWSETRNPYDMHRAIWRLFPGEAAESRRTQDQPRQGFLFRVEQHRAGRSAQVLIQSRRMPQPEASMNLIGSREIDPQPSQGQRLAFILTANPIKTIKDRQIDSKPGKTRDTCRVPLITEETQRSWLIQRLKDVAEVEVVSVTPHPPLYFRKANRGGKVLCATFEGLLTVLDPKALVARLENGLGPAKSLGCGLLLVRRITP
ncbi:type I-E CRISPR-associated protein Cas6/Cse3/CasE [Imhoffiella purpurea]|uniref:CRISPR-associated protein, Cse3 family n=1 Tax=Imhoffiella purpurea TaxID=1249627 RepID=W9VVT3_9GAMM|nr:type I-E CRISPR-associated protein Cas6/Cse3/CasE [Imhoffiella purpurea]EXJ14560.1 CRISPR-associated protein, Cse3 family [Imhoffiella purpurea]